MSSTRDYGIRREYQNEQDPFMPQSGPDRTYVVVVEEEDEFDDPFVKFANKSRRMLFVRKVLGAVGFQFLACTLFIALCQFEPSFNNFFHKDVGQAVGFVCSFAWLILFIAISCCNVGYGKPNATNMSLMIISTALLSAYLGAFTVHYDQLSILIAAGTTVGVLLILSIITFNTKIDITDKGMWILGALLALFLFSFISTILYFTGVISLENRIIIALVVSGFCAMIFAVMILYQLQLIVGGGKYKYGEDDWLLASITLFYDIALFFLEILQITRWSQ